MAKRIAIILACLVLAGCVGPKEQARSTFDDIISDCDAKTVLYQADASGPVHEFIMTCEVLE